MEKFDVAIIGAGIVGLMTAYRLSQRGLRICVFEKQKDVGLGVTSGQANVIHVVQLPFSSRKSKLSREGNMMYDDICRDLGVKILRVPALIVIRRWWQYPVLLFSFLYLYKNLHKQFRTQLLGGSNLRKLEPNLASGIIAGIVVHGYGTIDVDSLVSKLKMALETKTVSLIFDCEVTGAIINEKSTTIKTSRGDHQTNYVVNSAGLYSDDIALKLGKDVGRLEPGLGVMAIYSGLEVHSIISLLSLEIGARTKGGAIIPATNGTTILGPTLRLAESKEERTYTQDDLTTLQRKFFPLLKTRGELLRVYTGVRPLSPTKDFIVDVDPTKRIVNLVGIESPGLTAAPALAKTVEEAILGNSI